MNNFNMTVVAVALGVAFGATALAQGMSKAEHKTAKAAIEAGYKSAKASCDPLNDKAKDICLVDAKGQEGVALAQLEATYRPSQKSRYELSIARADADYGLAKEKCDDQVDNAKDVCRKEAKAAHVAAKADAKMHLKTVEANRTAAGKS